MNLEIFRHIDDVIELYEGKRDIYKLIAEEIQDFFEKNVFENIEKNNVENIVRIDKNVGDNIEENIEKEDVYYVDKINIVFDTMKRIDINGYKMIMIIFNQYFYEMYFELTIVDGLHLKEYEFK